MLRTSRGDARPVLPGPQEGRGQDRDDRGDEPSPQDKPRTGNAPAAFPFLGLGRVQELAVELGWRSTPLPEADLNYFPLPHA